MHKATRTLPDAPLRTRTVEMIGGPFDGDLIEIDPSNAPLLMHQAFRGRPYPYAITRTYASPEATLPNGIAYTYVDPNQHASEEVR